jgi:hypothetical protein
MDDYNSKEYLNGIKYVPLVAARPELMSAQGQDH